MATRVHSRLLAAHLEAQGMLPANCRLLDFVITPDGALIIKYEVFVTSDDLVKFAAAFSAAAQAVAKKDDDAEPSNLQRPR